MLSATWQDAYIRLLEESVFAPVSSFGGGTLLSRRPNVWHKAVPRIFIHCDDVGWSCIYSWPAVPCGFAAPHEPLIQPQLNCRGRKLWLGPRVRLTIPSKAAASVHDGDMRELTRLNSAYHPRLLEVVPLKGMLLLRSSGPVSTITY